MVSCLISSKGHCHAQLPFDIIRIHLISFVDKNFACQIFCNGEIDVTDTVHVTVYLPDAILLAIVLQLSGV